MAKRKLPDYIGGTHRAWKQKKRREWRAVVRAFETFRLGCAFTPSYEKNQIGRFEDAMKLVTEELSFKAWGR